MSHSRKKPAPAVVSTGCASGLMSCLLLRRRAPPPPPPSGDDAAAEQYYSKRVQFLEEEIGRLGRKWLAQDHEEKTKTTSTAAGRSNAKATCRDQESSTGAGTTTTKRCVRVGHGGGGGVQEIARLEDGSYLHEIIVRVGRPWKRLAVQVSQPVVPADATTASEVLGKMTMSKAEDLREFLAKMMPMKDIAGRRHHDEPAGGETVRRRTARLNSGDDFLEAVLFNALDRMEGLVLEGLKIQMSATSTATNFTAADAEAERKRDEAAVSNEDRTMVPVVLLVQMRDPEEGYGAIGDPMMGLLEASLERRKDARVKVEVRGLHVAGIVSFARGSHGSSHGRGLLWSASRRECRESRDGDDGHGRRCSYVRNANRVFRR